MKTYFPYSPQTPRQVYGEVHVVQDGAIILNHIPFLNSVEIDGFVQTDSTVILPHQYQCNYANETFYRESNCQVNFNAIHNGETVVVNYLQVGTIITADDLNEIKEHIENDSIHDTYILPPATPISRGGFRPGEGCEMVGDILNVTVKGGGLAEVPVASDSNKGGVIINGNGLKMLDETLSLNTGGGLSVNSNGELILKINGALTINSNGELVLKLGDGLAVDSNGMLTASGYTLPAASTDSLGGVKPGNGLLIDANGVLTLNLGNGLQIVNGVIVPNLGSGLALDDDGKIIYKKEISTGGWAYQDSGFDVIPAAPLIYVNDTQFYQPELNAQYSDMFDTPDGIMEFWIRCDVFLTSDFAYDDRFGFGYQNKNHTPDDYNYIATLWNGAYSSSGRGYTSGLTGYDVGCFIYGDTSYGPSRFAKTNLLFDKGANNHILFHAVSHPTEGYLEVTINHGTYRAENRNVNNGNPFTNFFVYSKNDHALFSNFIVSSTQIPYEEDGD